MEPVRYGLIGMGRWARGVHLKVLNQIPEAEIVALSSRSEENLKAASALAKGEPKLYRDYRQLLSDPEVEAVVICTPNHTHAELTRQALEAGKHVFCEKPLALSLDEHRSLSRLAEEKGLALQVGFELRYAPMFTRLKRMVDEGEVGKVGLLWCHLFRAPLSKGWRMDREASGGLFLELCSHYVDLLNWFSNSRPVSAFATAGNFTGHVDYDHVALTLEYENGVKGSLLVSLFAPEDMRIRLGVVGDRARCEVDILGRTLEVKERGTGISSTHHFPPPLGIEEPGFPGTYAQHLEFIRCVREGRKPRPGAEESAWTLAVALAAEESMAKGQKIAVPQVEV